MKQFDLVDVVLGLVFVIVTGTMCYMMATSQPVPELLTTIFWTVAVGLGLKKVPQTLGK